MSSFNVDTTSDAVSGLKISDAPREVVFLSPEKPITLKEVAMVAKNLSLVSVEEDVYTQMDSAYTNMVSVSGKEEDGKVDISVESLSLSGVSSSGNRFICRAALLMKLVALYKANTGIRSDIAKMIVEMLNKNVIPQFSSDENAGKELALSLMCDSVEIKFYSPADDTALVSSSEFFTMTGLSPIVFSSSIEMQTLIKGQFYAKGAVSLIAAGAYNIAQMVDGVAALSCESYCANIDSLKPELFESYRQHSGQIMSSTNIMLLLEGSRRALKDTAASVGGKGGGKGQIKDDPSSNNWTDSDNSAFALIPQLHGPAKDSILNACKLLNVEMNSTEPKPLSADKCGFDPTQCYSALHMIVSGLSMIQEASLSRYTLLCVKSDASSKSNAKVAATTELSFSNKSESLASAFAFLEFSENQISDELKLTLDILAEVEKKAAANAADVALKAEKNAKKVEAYAGKQKGGTDLSNKSPAEIAKIEAARKKKEEKAAAKKAQKDSKKGELVIGNGTKLLRSHFLDGTSADVDAFNYSDQSFGFKCMQTLQEMDSRTKVKPKVAKGTRDYGPDQMRIREQVFSTIRRVFKRHGGVEIDTPVFELKSVLTGKYGEDTKLIYDLADQGGEILGLRYDLTVPFARFLAMHSVGNIKRYHIAKVYRRDQPVLSRGRYREFYQCDFDIAGSYSSMVPDAEAITVACEILNELPVGQICVKLNHRCILDAIFEIAGVPSEKFRTICSAVDKLDKASWEEVRKEMVDEKGLSLEVADKIGEFVLNAGEPFKLWKELQESGKFGQHEGALKALGEMKLLFEYLEAMKSLQYVSFDLSLARGLDYYTGVIYEVVIIEGDTAVGSIAAGGRYDNLVGMFSASDTQTPCVGVSIGVERVFTIIEKKSQAKSVLKRPNVQVYIASIGGSSLAYRMRIAQSLWEINISAEYSSKENPKLKSQMDECLEKGIPFMVIFGEDEIAKSVVKLKNMHEHTEVEVELANLGKLLIEQGCDAIPSDDVKFLDTLR